MSELLSTFTHFASSYVATVGIALVCAYLGLFTVLRRIVFTGVALAQMAAAGVAAAIYIGDHPRSPAALAEFSKRNGETLGSLGMALLGAIGLEIRRERRKVSADALVGLAYAASAALSILLVWRSAHGLAELKNILAGEVLLARTSELVALWAGLLGVTAVHIAFRPQFLLVSYDPEFAQARGLPARRYQVLLMSSLAVAVALSLKIGGLVLVFALLVLPPVAGLQLGRTLNEATWVALATAVGSALVGFLVAIQENLPVAPTVATALLVLVGLAWLGTAHPRAGPVVRGLLAFLGGLAILAAVFAGVSAATRPAPEPAPAPTPIEPEKTRSGEHHHDHEHDAPQPLRKDLKALLALLEEGETQQRVEAAHLLEDLADPRALEPLVSAFGDEERSVRKAVGEAIACLAAQKPARDRLHALLRDEEPHTRINAALALVRVGDLAGVEALVKALGDEEQAGLDKERALTTLRLLNRGKGFGYDPLAEEPEKNAKPLATWRSWWRTTGKRLHWEPKQARFRVP